MKKISLLLPLFFISVLAFSIPAQRGIWRMATLPDGTTVRLELQGDENLHYWRAADGKCYELNENDMATPLPDIKALQQEAQTRVAAQNIRRQMRRKNLPAARKAYTGKKKGLIIMVEFSDKKFNVKHTKQLVTRMANEEGFTHSYGFKGSIHDYFKDQSNGAFDLTFDVVGPVKLRNKMFYYGRDLGFQSGNDARPGEMVAEACQMIKDSVNFVDYDWDNDGEVDQVYVMYAGYGQASGGTSDTIWPHEWQLSSSDYRGTLELDGVKIDTYACSNELDERSRLAGIGTACHEFTHCLGFPDMYDTSGNGAFGMHSWDLMDYGSYNDKGYTPAGYTGYEKIEAGWLTPVVLRTDTLVERLLPLSENGTAFLVYNDNAPNEYYILENRKKTHWDAALPGEGLLILHVDYNAARWRSNTVNTTPDHQRCSIFHADNSDGISLVDLAGDPFPFKDNDSLTLTSLPRASVFNANTDGSENMNKSILNIRRNADGDISFRFRVDRPFVVKGDTLFYESFDRCNGTGGNDNLWGGALLGDEFLTDNAGWQVTHPDTQFGADKCARFGTASTSGILQSPAITIVNGAVITFKAAPWVREHGALNIYSSNSGVTFTPSTFNLVDGHWTTCTATFHTTASTATLNLTFVGKNKRFFLDEVLILRSQSTGITEHPTSAPYVLSSRIYAIDGRYLGTDFSLLPPGLYIVDGKKVVK